jgi:hypothetical protein
VQSRRRVFKADYAKREIAVSDEEVAAYYKATKDNFTGRKSC